MPNCARPLTFPYNPIWPKPDPTLKRTKRQIGLVGTNGAGKSAVCDYLRQRGYLIVSLSDIVRAEVRHHHRPESRDSLVQTANEMKARYGADVLARRAFHETDEKEVDSIVFDSVRNLDEVQFLRSKGVIFLGIDAPVDLRYERVKLRARESDLVDYETFVSHDDRENKGISSGQHIFRAFEECQTIIRNDGSIDQLKRDVDAFIAATFEG